MSRRKGVSADEKRRRMLDYLREERRVFKLKDLEKTLPKLKGIVSQSVKEVLLSLVDDNLAETDKIGSGNFYWVFPSKELVNRQNKVTALKGETSALSEEKEALLSRKRKLLEGREPTEERSAKLQKIDELRAAIGTADAELSKYSSCDPTKIKEKKDAIRLCFEGANRWTDNIFNVLSYFKKKRPDIKQEDILKHFELPTELDNVVPPQL